VKKEKNTEKVIRDLIKSNITFFLLREQDENNEIIKVLEDSIKLLKDDIKSLEDKKNELNRMLSVKKDMLDRNYISAKLKRNNDSINNKKSQLKDKEEKLKQTRENMSKKEIEKKEEVPLEEKFIPKKAAKVVFDKSTGKSWEVMFTDRGFEIGKTRLSFENVEEAINKNFNIILDAGNGLVLDQNKLNKIMKYKGRF